jgi:hypothetical protein
MPAQGFLSRWARLKAQGGAVEPAGPEAPRAPPHAALAPLAQTTPHPPVAPAPAAPPQAPPPSLEDVARLSADSDFSAFVTQGVDKAVQRLAMKKLFSDPHFNLMDGLDVYIDDYTKSDPLPAAMMASLEHARDLFAHLSKDEQADDGKATPPPPPDAPPPQPPQSDA